MMGERLALRLGLTAAEVVERMEHLLLRIGVRWTPRGRKGERAALSPGKRVAAPEMTGAAARRHQ